jgi:hypothetical protein
MNNLFEDGPKYVAMRFTSGWEKEFEEKDVSKKRKYKKMKSILK